MDLLKLRRTLQEQEREWKRKKKTVMTITKKKKLCAKHSFTHNSIHKEREIDNDMYPSLFLWLFIIQWSTILSSGKAMSGTHQTHSIRTVNGTKDNCCPPRFHSSIAGARQRTFFEKNHLQWPEKLREINFFLSFVRSPKNANAGLCTKAICEPTKRTTKRMRRISIYIDVWLCCLGRCVDEQGKPYTEASATEHNRRLGCRKILCVTNCVQKLGFNGAITKWINKKCIYK